MVGCDLPKNQRSIPNSLLPNISDPPKPSPIHVTDIDTEGNTAGGKEASVRKAHGIRCYGEDIPPPITTFDHPRIPLNLQKRLKSTYGRPTPVQAQALPLLLEQRERDAIIVAPTGTGKTLVFLTTILAVLTKKDKGSKGHGRGDKRRRAIVLAPTKELVKQTEQELIKLRDPHQSLATRIMVTTPLSLIKRIKSGLDVSKVKQLVLDEADKLLEGGFLEQLDTILQAIMQASSPTAATTTKKGKRPRVTLFSATIPSGIEDIARSFMSPDTVRIVIGSPMGSLSSIKQELLFVGQEEGKAMAIKI